MLHQRVDNHIPGASVEGENIFWFRVGRNYGDVCDAADIQCNAANFRIAIEKVVHKRNERSALATDGDIRRTKIGNRCDSCSRGDNCGFADLKRAGGMARATNAARTALMKNSLSVGADER